MNGLVRTGLGLALGALVVTSLTGCRSTSTDRIRVLEAQKAASERKNRDLNEQAAELRARQIEADAEAEAAAARAEALQRQVDANRNASTSYTEVPVATVTTTPTTPVVPIDARRFDDLNGNGVEVSDREGGAAIVLSSDVSFHAGKADLSKGALSALRKVARTLKSTNGVRTIRVEGHTDSDPIRKSGWKSNEELSLARAQVVKRYLVRQGVTNGLFEVDGLGAARPVAKNSSKSGKARNRRVEIVVLGD